jgi:hypothetical protein
MRFWFLPLVILSLNPLVAQQTSSFVGKNSCELKLGDDVGSYSERLDASQHAYLEAHKVNGKYLLFIVQYPNKERSCGKIVDIAEAQHPGAHFEFNCEDLRAPKDVVVGLWPEKRKAFRGRALKAWKVALNNLHFVPLSVSARCVIRGGAGNDYGGDLRAEAEKRVTKP